MPTCTFHIEVIKCDMRWGALIYTCYSLSHDTMKALKCTPLVYDVLYWKSASRLMKFTENSEEYTGPATEKAWEAHHATLLTYLYFR